MPQHVNTLGTAYLRYWSDRGSAGHDETRDAVSAARRAHRVALWVVTLIVPGIAFVGGDSTAARVGIIFVVAVIFGLVNAVIKPVVQLISIPLYILTLGLFHIVINALMLWITSWITEHTTHWGLFIDDFWWTAIWAAIVLSVVSWLLSLIVRAD